MFNKIIDKPEHVVIVMDGNGRWAKARDIARRKGHQAGAKVAKEIIKHASGHGIRCLSLFAFSSENWLRPKPEVNFLMELFITTLNRELTQLHQQGLKLVFTGSMDNLSTKIQNLMLESQLKTKDNTGMILNIVFNYGGRWDIVQASKKIAQKVQDGLMTIDEINDASFANDLCLTGMPEPDLFIRTSGEYRISNFFLWQLAYAELYFTPTFWPDFNNAEFDKAIEWYQHRERRFGQTSEQIYS